MWQWPLPSWGRLRLPIVTEVYISILTTGLVSLEKHFKYIISQLSLAEDEAKLKL